MAQHVDRRGFLGLSAAATAAAVVGTQWTIPERAQAAGKVPVRTERHRAVVIGTGFGGAVAAYNLSQAGVQTLVLERGRRWDILTSGETFPRFFRPDRRVSWMRNRPVFPGSLPVPLHRYAGLVDRVEGKGTDIICGAGVGGSSLIFVGMMLKPTEELFGKAFTSDINYAEMERVYYPRVEKRLGIHMVPDDVLDHKHYRSSRIFLDHAQRAGIPAGKIANAVDWDIVRAELAGKIGASASNGDYLYGVNSGARNSVDRNYLAAAERTPHVEVRPLHVVTYLAVDAQGKYVVHCDRITEDGDVIERKEITCDALFLGAGSAGTSQLLVRARDTGGLSRLNEHIGGGWGNNGNRIYTRLLIPEDTGRQQGGPPCVAITDWDNPGGPIAIEHGGVKLDVNPHLMSLIAVGGIPDKRGEFIYDSDKDRVVLHWPEDADKSAVAVGKAVIKNLVKAGGGRYVDNSNRDPTAFHPLGGAVLGEACDTYGRVDGYRGLYVVDGALVPGTTPGCNPSWTIAALAERCMDNIVKKDVGKIF